MVCSKFVQQVSVKNASDMMCRWKVRANIVHDDT